MTSQPPRRAPRTLTSLEGAELVVKLPRGGVLMLPGDCAIEVRSGRVQELSAGAPPPQREPAPPRGPRDLRIEKALRAMRSEPARRWTVEQLAKLAGASRTAFARAFVASTGETPGAWLARFRLELARELVEGSAAKLAEIAARVGYASEFALSRAFKQRYGVAPAILRHTLRIGSDTIRCAA